MLEAIQKAQASFKADVPSGFKPGGYSIEIDMLKQVGRGYEKGTGAFRGNITKVKVSLDEFGRPITAYPSLR